MIRRPPISTLTYTLFPYTALFRSLDAVNWALLITLLSSLSAPTPEKDGVKDARTPALRRADGFCELLRRYERAGLGPIEGGVKPHITVTASAKDMTDLQALKDQIGRASCRERVCQYE